VLKARIIRRYQTMLVSTAITVLWSLSVRPLEAQTTQEIVSSFYPQTLISAAKLSPDQEQVSCSATYDPGTIIAAYSNGVQGVVSVLKSGANNIYTDIYDFNSPGLGGQDCSVTLISLNGSNSNQIVVSFSSLRGNTMDWVFTWDGQKLSNIGPTITDGGGNVVTAAMNADFVDVNHNGTLQILSIGQYPPPMDGSPPLTANTLYQLSPGGSFKPYRIQYSVTSQWHRLPCNLRLQAFRAQSRKLCRGHITLK
jgi:hypothetical protein